jgi:hypothetical protein
MVSERTVQKAMGDIYIYKWPRDYIAEAAKTLK